MVERPSFVLHGAFCICDSVGPVLFDVSLCDTIVIVANTMDVSMNTLCYYCECHRCTVVSDSSGLNTYLVFLYWVSLNSLKRKQDSSFSHSPASERAPSGPWFTKEITPVQDVHRQCQPGFRP